MGRKSQDRRQARRSKAARKWAMNEKAVRGAFPNGLNGMTAEEYSRSRSQRPARRRDI